MPHGMWDGPGHPANGALFASVFLNSQWLLLRPPSTRLKLIAELVQNTVPGKFSIHWDGISCLICLYSRQDELREKAKMRMRTYVPSFKLCVFLTDIRLREREKQWPEETQQARKEIRNEIAAEYRSRRVVVLFNSPSLLTIVLQS